MLFEEEKQLRKLLMHNEAPCMSYKKMIRTEKNKKKREERQRKAWARLERWLKPQVLNVLRQYVEQKEQPALKLAKGSWLLAREKLRAYEVCQKSLLLT